MAKDPANDVLDEEDEDLEAGKGKPAAKPEKKEEAAGETITIDLEEGEGEGEDDERLAVGAKADEDREQIRDRRRKEKKERRERQQAAKARSEREISELRERLATAEARVGAVETGTVQQTIAQINQRMVAAKGRYDEANRIMIKAISAADGEATGEALRIRDEARDEYNGLAAYKAQAERAAKQPTAQPREQGDGVDAARTKRYTDTFLAKHDWFTIGGDDEDSALVTALDLVVAKKFKPDTKEYWDELERRIAKALPHRVSDDDDDDDDEEPKPKPKPRNKAPAIGSGSRSQGGVSKRSEFFVSPERKAAMIEAGSWDDPVKRKKQVLQYMAYDKAHPTAR